MTVRGAISLNEFLEKYGINRRTFYRWKEAGIAPRETKIGRLLFIFAQDEAGWVQRHRSATAAIENRVTQLTVRLAETALELAGKPTPEQSMDILHRAEGLAHQLIIARADRARLAGDEAAAQAAGAEHDRVCEVNREAWKAATDDQRAQRYLAGA